MEVPIELQCTSYGVKLRFLWGRQVICILLSKYIAYVEHDNKTSKHIVAATYSHTQMYTFTR